MSNITSDGTVMGGTPFFGGMNNWGGGMGIAPFGLFGLASLGRGGFGAFGDGCCDGGGGKTLANDVLLLNQIDSKVSSATTPIALSLAGIKESMESAAILGAIGGVKDEVCDVKTDLSAFAANTACQFQGVNHKFSDVFKEIECAKVEIIQASKIALLEDKLRCSEDRRRDDETKVIKDSILVLQSGIGNIASQLGNFPLTAK